MTEKRDPRGASRKSPKEKNSDPIMANKETHNIDGVDYPSEITMPRIDPRAALIRHWMDKSFNEDAVIIGTFVLATESLRMAGAASVLGLVTPQVWDRMEQRTGGPLTTRMDVLEAFYRDKLITRHPTKGDIGLVPRMAMAMAQALDCWAQKEEGEGYVAFMRTASDLGFVEMAELFEQPEEA